MSTTEFRPGYKKLPWRDSPADFVAFIDELTAVHAIWRAQEPLMEEEMGELFLLVFDVDIHPYPDFRTMRTAVQPGATPLLVIYAFLQLIMENLIVEEALSGTSVTRCIDMKKEERLEAFAQDLVERLGVHMD